MPSAATVHIGTAACPVGEVDGGLMVILLEIDAAMPNCHHVTGKSSHEQVEHVGSMHPAVVDRRLVRRGPQEGRHYRAIGMTESAVRPTAPPAVHSVPDAEAAQHAQPVRLQCHSGSYFGERSGLFKQLDVDASLAQRKRSGRTADTATEIQDPLTR